MKWYVDSFEANDGTVLHNASDMIIEVCFHNKHDMVTSSSSA
jgi:hypothetical protein